MTLTSIRTLGRLAAALAAAVALAAAPHAQAQGGNCGPPDGFTGPCCAPAQPTLPGFPAVAFQDGMKLCFIDCGPQSKVLNTLTISAPAPDASAGCGVYTAAVGGGLASGIIRLNYTRSWVEVGGGPPLRVFRFVVTGNVTPAPSPIPCQIEQNPAGTVGPFFYGYMDYAYSCTGAAGLAFKAAAIVIGHTCDRFMHDGSCPFTAFPGAFHPFDSTVLLAPGSNFVPSGTLTPPSGVATGLPNPRQGIRALDPTLCTVNDRFTSISLANGPKECLCIQPPPNIPQPFTRQEIKGATVCGESLGAAAFCPYIPTAPSAGTLVTWSIGRFLPGAYPGRPNGYRVFLTEGADQVVIPQPCNGTPPQAPREVVYGAETSWNFPLGLAQKRVDLVSNVNPATLAPMVGGQGVASRVIFFY